MLHGVQKLQKQTMLQDVQKLQQQTKLLWISIVHFLSLQFFACQSCKTQWSTSFSFGFHLYTKDRKITTSHPSFESGSC
jgi:hypothetical protein